MSQSQYEKFLAESSAQGERESEGAFTINFGNAAERLADFALPSHHHYLLKIVQLASRLGANSLGIKLESSRTSVHFKAPKSGLVGEAEAIIAAFSDPLNVKDATMSDLVSALLGCLGNHTQEVLWSSSEGYHGRRIFIKDNVFRTEAFDINRPLADGQHRCAFTLSVLHPKTWRFWLNSRRNADAFSLLAEACSLARVAIKVDSRDLRRAPSNFYCQHRVSNVHWTNQGLVSPGCRPYHNVLYGLSKADDAGFELMRPSTSGYVVRDRVVNLWASGIRVSNTLVPDGISSPTWMLQFRDDNGDDLSMRLVDKRARCRFVIAYDTELAKNQGAFRMTLVRQSVILFSRDLPNWLEKQPLWSGCHLILDDDSLATDLSGFQVIEDQQFENLLDSLQSQIGVVESFWSKGRTMLVGSSALATV